MGHTIMTMLRYPAEWENQAATWLAYPHHPLNWSGERKLKIQSFYHQLILQILEFQPVKLIVPPSLSLDNQFLELTQKSKHPLFIYPIKNNDIWIRDYGPFFVKINDETQIIKTEFNAWGEKFPPWDLDNLVPYKISKLESLKIHAELPSIFEGGAIEFNGDGLAMTTLECITGKHRNLNSKEVLDSLKSHFNLKDILVLPNGLYGDHTDGHIDNVARFVAKSRVVVASEGNPKSPQYERLKKAKTIINDWLKTHYPDDAKIDSLPMPPSIKTHDEEIPASYVNFIYVNNALIFPFYHKATDKIVLNYFETLYPHKKIIGIDCSMVIEEGGSLHCMSKQEPI